MLTATPAVSTVALGSTVTFTCTSSLAATEYKLFLNNQLFAHVTTHEVTIGNLDASFSGSYTCAVVVNQVESSVSNTYVLTVEGK